MNKKSSEPKSQINPLSHATCPTLSRRSTLSYELGRSSDKAVHFRITHNDGGGFFSPEWVAWSDILDAIKNVQPVTSSSLRAIFKGKSVNTSGFLLAVLIAEGLLEALPKKSRHFKATGKTPAVDEANGTGRGTTASASPKKAKADNAKATKA